MAWEQQRNLTRQQMQEKLVFPIKLDMLAVVGTGLLVVSRCLRPRIASSSLYFAS